MNRWQGGLLGIVAAGLSMFVAAPAVGVETRDYVVSSPVGQALQTPPSFVEQGRSDGGVVAQADKNYRYAISVVGIPMKGKQLGANRKSIRRMIDNVGQRMRSQTSGKVTYKFRSWQIAPRVTSAKTTCDVGTLHKQYSQYTRGLRKTPGGFDDTIALYVSPQRAKCPFAGLALLGRDATYLNGVDLQDPQRLQNWITAHELGHNLGLVHSGSFAAERQPWDPANDHVPHNSAGQESDEYGDYLDVMGKPANDGRKMPDADFSDWVIGGVNLLNLGVLPDRAFDVVRTSGIYQVGALTPAGSKPLPSVLGVPIIADRVKAFWALEFRPASQSVTSGLNYPLPWVLRGYGVRLLAVEHPSASTGYSTNRVFHESDSPRSAAVLPIGVPIELGGKATVTVLTADAAGTSASIAISIPKDISPSVTFPNTQRLENLRPGKAAWLQIWTRQGREISWSVQAGKSSCRIVGVGRGPFTRDALALRSKSGECVVRARAPSIPYAFFAGLDESVKYAFSHGNVTRELLP